MINSAGLLDELLSLGIEHEVEHHQPIFTMADSDALELSLDGMRCKNLLLRDRKGKHYLLMTTAEKSVDLSRLSQALGSGRLSLASPERLFVLLGVRPGALSPLALVNDTERQVELILDEDLGTASHYVLHPLDNGISVQLSSAALQRFLIGIQHHARWVAIAARS
ncbi:prolyl-tRNA synthetase associated domain-containing protein [Pseudomonas sp. LRF_L74]|uniref:prolyl-tRNA synthetase associated domain-containing protein n=1 Tax=Pseudomonas sp. LRF_L74 TaxID=3369422 RepID=UPI003F5FD2E4